MKFVDLLRMAVRRVMCGVARFLNKISGGRITPNMVTIVGAILHIPIAVFIALGWWIAAAVMLVIFGLFDALDGEMARLLKRESHFGMVLDASTDRVKETLIYSGAVYYFASNSQPLFAGAATLALGFSICVSYVKARGEIAVATSHHKKFDHQTLNKKLFPSGLLPFEIRMFLLAAGLVAGAFYPLSFAIVVTVIALGSFLTFIQRLYNIKKTL